MSKLERVLDKKGSKLSGSLDKFFQLENFQELTENLTEKSCSLIVEGFKKIKGNEVSKLLRLLGIITETNEGVEKTFNNKIIETLREQCENYVENEFILGCILVIISNLSSYSGKKKKSIRKKLGEEVLTFLVKYSKEHAGNENVSLNRQVCEIINVLCNSSNHNKNLIITNGLEKDIFETLMGTGDYYSQSHLIEVLARVMKFVKKNESISDKNMDKKLLGLLRDKKVVEKFKKIGKDKNISNEDLRKFLFFFNEKFEAVTSLKCKSIKFGEKTFVPDKKIIHIGTSHITFMAMEQNELDMYDFQIGIICKIQDKKNHVLLELTETPNFLSNEEFNQETDKVKIFMNKKEITKFTKDVVIENEDESEEEDVTDSPKKKSTDDNESDVVMEDKKERKNMRVSLEPFTPVNQIRGVKDLESPIDDPDDFSVEPPDSITPDTNRSLFHNSGMKNTTKKQNKIIALNDVESNKNPLNRRKRKHKDISLPEFDDIEEDEVEEDDSTEEKIIGMIKQVINQHKIKKRKLCEKIFLRTQKEISQMLKDFEENIMNEKERVIKKNRPLINKIEIELRKNSEEMQSLYEEFKKNIDNHIIKHNSLTQELRNVKTNLSENISEYYTEEKKEYKELIKKIKDKVMEMKNSIDVQVESANQIMKYEEIVNIKEI